MASLVLTVGLMFLALLLLGPIIYGLSFIKILPDNRRFGRQHRLWLLLAHAADMACFTFRLRAFGFWFSCSK